MQSNSNISVDSNLKIVKKSFAERGYAFHHQVDCPGRIWRHLYAETEEVFVALTHGLSVSINGRLKKAMRLEEVFIAPGTCFNIIGRAEQKCEWAYGYEIAGTTPETRILRRAGVLAYEDWQFNLEG